MIYNLENYIKNIIIDRGALTLDRFMQLVSHYYYSNYNSIGQDFITAPEISQMFGEMIGIYIVDIWYNSIQKPIHLVELGPGNGTMMYDVLRTIKTFQEVYENINRVILIENSHLLKTKQQKRLECFGDINMVWYQNIEEVKENNLFILANEFFDALPIKQYHFQNGTLCEVVVMMDQNHNLIFGSALSNCPPFYVDKLKEHQFIEVSLQREEYAKSIAGKIRDKNGHALIIDYGYKTTQSGSTLQALKSHAQAKILELIGCCDITSLVDFSSLANSFAKFGIQTTITTQRDFLLNLGILQRAEMLQSKSASVEKIQHQINKLTSKEEMGELFKVLIASSYEKQGE